MIDVALLGTGGTMPMPNRPLSAAVVRCDGRLTLWDCGEGTQVELRRLGWGFRALDRILISHFHADHIGGLPGLLLSVGNSERGPEEPLTIFGPPGLTQIVAGLRVIAPVLPFPVVCRELTGEPDQVVELRAPTPSAAAGQSGSSPSVTPSPLELRVCWGDHELPCLAYRLHRPRARAFNPAAARALAIPMPLWRQLQHGVPVTHDGKSIPPEGVLGPPRPGLSVGLVTDTRPTAELARFLAGADLLISEASYGDPADADKAATNKHMTFAEAAGLARAAGVGRLWLTHFSPALDNPAAWAEQATTVFPATVLGQPGYRETLRFAE